MTTQARTRIDPITFEVVKHRLRQVNDEQGATITTISTSPIVVEGNDFNVGLFTREGDVAIAGPYVLTHCTTMDTVIKNILATVDDISDGDVFLVNDPYVGALHQNDVALATPLFHDGELRMWAGNVLHHADLAGIDEGSFCINARNVFQEAPRYFLKLVDAGRLRHDVERTFTLNSRLPDMVALDLRAQLGALNVARRRLVELIDDVGIETLDEVMRRVVDDAEEQLRARILELPDGAWRSEVFMDTDKVGSDRIIRVALELRKEGDRLVFDYEGTDPQSEGAVNAPFHASYAGTIVPVYTFLCNGEIDWNGAVKRCVEVRAPIGSVMNAQYPAAVSICSIGFTWLATAAALKVVAQMLSASERYADRVCPSWNSACNGNNVFGNDRNGRFVGALLSDHRGGGAAARPFADGFDTSGKVTSHLGFLSNVESQEWKLPILYAWRMRLPDSGGPGMFRGGMTSAVAIVPHKTGKLIWKSQNTAGSDQSNASGIHGGYPGAGSQVSVVRNSRVRQAWAASDTAVGHGALGGTVEHLPSKSEGTLGPDDVLVFFAPGGGGYGDPLDRDPGRVARDVRIGAVSPTAAYEHYGVVLDERNTPDVAATAERRTAIRTERLGDPPPIVGEVPPANGQTVGPYLVVDGAGADQTIRCRRCSYTLGAGTAGIDPADLPGAVVSRAPLREAGPWLAMRFGGESPNFQLAKRTCPGCGTLLDVVEERSGGAS
jgi:N-methylhydantoinase B